MIVGQGAYREGRPVEVAGDFADLARACGDTSAFAWVGLKDPEESELEAAAMAFGIHPLALDDARGPHERPKVDIVGDTLTVVLRPARYREEDELVEIGQITVLCSPRHILVIRHGDAVPLNTLRSRMEARPDWLDQGPGAVLHAIVETVVDAYQPVLTGIDDDISEVEELVFSPALTSPTQRIYELKREVLEFRKAAVPLADVLSTLSNLEHPVLNDELHLYFNDTGDSLRRIIDQVHTENELLTSALEANLTQVSLRQNEDMRKMSAWVAILAVPTMVAGIYGMNFRHMPELETRYGYFVVMAFIIGVCLALYRGFKRAGWL